MIVAYVQLSWVRCKYAEDSLPREWADADIVRPFLSILLRCDFLYDSVHLIVVCVNQLCVRPYSVHATHLFESQHNDSGRCQSQCDEPSV